MNNELYRKLTSITLMTIMFAGGMTIAIPGETPVAVAQTGMLSVSATAAPGNSFGGAQIIQIVVDDPTRSETGTNISTPDVTIDDTPVTLVQADTGKWYGHVANFINVADDPDTLTPPTGATVAVTSPPMDDGTAINTIQRVSFDDDSDIDVVLGDETITLHYEQDLDDLVTVSTDRAGVPEGGHVHVTVSDFRLNLDPTGEDRWTVFADGSMAAYGNEAATEIAGDDNWVGFFGGLGGKFTVTADDDDVVDVTNVTNTNTNTDVEYVILAETGANTGVFESQNDNDSSNIVVTGVENDDFTIAYADSDVQVFIESFDTTLEMIASGTWDSGEPLTVRLTDENLNTNTLTDQDLGIGDSLPVLTMGTPITLKDLDSTTTYDADENATTAEVPRGTIKVDSNTRVGALAIPDTENSTAVAFTLELTEGQVDQINNGNSYIHYVGPAVEVAGLNDANDATTPVDILVSEVDKPSLTAVNITDAVNEDGSDVTEGASITLTYTNDGDNSDRQNCHI